MNIKRWFTKPHISISDAEAIEIARNECELRGWPWLEPVNVLSRSNSWIVHTNSESKGANTKIRIDKRTGKIIAAIFMPR